MFLYPPRKIMQIFLRNFNNLFPVKDSSYGKEIFVRRDGWTFLLDELPRFHRTICA
jgi:hypothetical protein